MSDQDDASWMRGVSLAAEYGGPDVSVAPSVQALRDLLRNGCQGPYSKEVLGFALALRIDGSMKQYRPVGVDRVRRSKKDQYIGADICIPESKWKGVSEGQFNRYLSSMVGAALTACLDRLAKEKVEIEADRLLADYAKVESKFLDGTQYIPVGRNPSLGKNSLIDLLEAGLPLPITSNSIPVPLDRGPLKLHRTVAGVTEYWEAWVDGPELTIHWGKIGEEGATRDLPLEPGVRAWDIIEREAKPVRAAGFKPRNDRSLFSLVVQYKIEGHGTVEDLDRRVRVENLLNDSLGGSGLGRCVGAEIGSGEMAVFCRVVDKDLAVKTIVKDLEEHGELEGAFIAEQTNGGTRTLWPRSIERQSTLQ